MELAEDVQKRLQSVCEKRKIAFQVTGTPCIVQGVRQVLDEMVYNISENAIKYNREAGSITVTTGYKEQHPFIRVTDTGIGIPKAEQERVFERFYRVDKSHSKAVGGTGLGLSIVKHGAILHHATIHLDSTEQVGTTIEILFTGDTKQEEQPEETA